MSNKQGGNPIMNKLGEGMLGKLKLGAPNKAN